VINRRHSYLDRDPCRFPRAGIKPKPRSVLTGRSISGTGQITAVERSVTEGEECADILMLLATIRGGVNSLMAEILEDHIQLHLMHPNRAQQTPEELTEDLIGLVRAYLK
jgi:DNA-binding FrmR family transcriptional regulator